MWLGDTNPAWDDIDRQIITAWLRLNDDLCPDCGRPIAVHKTDDVGDYRAATWECTATRALDNIQAQWRDANKAGHESERKAGRSPERGLHWLTYNPVTEGDPA